MDYAVLQFGEFGAVPAVCRTYQVTCNPLERVDVMSVTMRTFLKSLRRILISAIQTSVAVMVHAAVTDVVLVHQVHDVHDGLRIMCRVTVDFHVEDMAAPFKIMIRSLYLGLALRRAMEVNRNVA